MHLNTFKLYTTRSIAPIYDYSIFNLFYFISKNNEIYLSIDIDVFAQRQFAEEGDFIEVTTARAVMVAINENNKPIALNK